MNDIRRFTIHHLRGPKGRGVADRQPCGELVFFSTFFVLLIEFLQLNMLLQLLKLLNLLS